MKLAVCIITYKRPNGLMRVLKGIGAQRFSDQRPDIRVVVVDNDETGSAGATCDAVRPDFAWALECSIEPRRGIPFARNTAIARAGDDVDYVAFIDDDEVPDPNWLDELLRVMKQYQADVVAGPVVPHFMEEPPAWVVKGKFYDRQRWPTGEVLDRAFTGNILFRREVFAGMGVLFDERMSLTGSSDSHFLQRVHRAGFRIVWADQALATEWVPPSRVGTRWILRRSFRVGTTTAFIMFDLHSMVKGRALVLASGCYHFFFGTVFLGVGWIRGRAGLVKSLREFCYGAGMLLGLLGTRYQEYRRTHGS
ncbi:MAG: glycosyltransferase family 2 protein [Planctomycetes bacterium]|nr:glycosyltransferase family 2 protein [Planctomycetota bacterium]